MILKHIRRQRNFRIQTLKNQVPFKPVVDVAEGSRGEEDKESENPFRRISGGEEGSRIYDFLYPDKELLPDDKEMSLFDHLEELRDRLFISILAVGGAMAGCFAFSKELIIILEAPVKAQGVRFLQLAPGEFFFTSLKVIYTNNEPVDCIA